MVCVCVTFIVVLKELDFSISEYVLVLQVEIRMKI